jgi:hypothetical protein
LSFGTARQVETYVDGTEAGTVAGSHVLVESLDGLSAGHLAELLVHVVGTGARVVAEPDTEVLNLEGALLGNLDEKRACE